MDGLPMESCAVFSLMVANIPIFKYGKCKIKLILTPKHISNKTIML
jgi:hypothetical protein